MKLRMLIEDYETFVGRKPTEDNSIYKNPSPAEFNKVGLDGFLRFIIKNENGNKTVYVFPDGLFHIKAAKALNIPYPINQNMIAGTAARKKGKWEAIDAYNLNQMMQKDFTELEDLVEKDWSNKYIDVSKILGELKKIVERKRAKIR